MIFCGVRGKGVQESPLREGGRVWRTGLDPPPPLSSGISPGLELWNSIDFLRFSVFPRSQEGDPRREPDAIEESWDHTRGVRGK